MQWYKNRMHIRVILDNVRSLHNVGSVFRTADAAGVEKIYLGGITPGPADRFGRIRPQFKKVALGAEQSVPWESVPDSAMKKLIISLKDDGYTVVAVEQHHRAKPYHAWKKHGKSNSKKIALIFGNEVQGVRPMLVRVADEVIDIPMNGTKESLNISVAVGIILFGLQY